MSEIDDLLQEVSAFDYKWFDEIGGNQAEADLGVLRKTVVALREEIDKLRDLIDFYQACGFVIFEHTEDDGRVSKFVGHAGADHYPPRPVE